MINLITCYYNTLLAQKKRKTSRQYEYNVSELGIFIATHYNADIKKVKWKCRYKNLMKMQI